MRRALRGVSSPGAAADLVKPSARRPGRDCSLCVFRRRRVYRRACREGVVMTAMVQAAWSRRLPKPPTRMRNRRPIRGGIGKKRLTRPSTLIVSCTFERAQ